MSSDDDPGRDELPARPVVNPAFVPVRVDSNRLQFRAGPWGGPTYTVTDDDGSLVDRLPELLDGETPVEDVVDALDADPEEVRTVLRGLVDRGVVREARGEDPARDVLAVEPEFTPDRVERVRDATVLVVDDGTLGATVRTDLADLGVSVETTADPREPEFGAAEVVAYCAESYRPDRLDAFNRAALETGTPLAVAHCLGVDGFVGPTVIPGETSCATCFRERLDGVAALARADPVSVPPYGRVLAGYLAVDVLHRLAYGVGFTAGRVVRFDFRTLSVEAEDVLRVPDCPACSRVDADPGHQPLVTVDRLVEDFGEAAPDE